MKNNNDWAPQTHTKPGLYPGASEGLALPSPQVAPVVLVLLQTQW
jgi:hypothetical protein